MAAKRRGETVDDLRARVGRKLERRAARTIATAADVVQNGRERLRRESLLLLDELLGDDDDD